MKRTTMLGLGLNALAIVLALASCVSAGSPATAPEKPAPVFSEADIGAIIAQGDRAMESNHLAEGIRYYVAARGHARQSSLEALAASLDKRLLDLAGRLSLEPHDSWLGPDGTQLPGSTRDASGGKGTMPAVYLYSSYGYEKSPVADASIRFVFTANEGELTALVRTDAKGLSNTTISSVKNPALDAVVRAWPVFESDGFTWEVSSVYRDFAYKAPQRLALVAALERTPQGQGGNPRLLDAAAEGIKALGVDTLPLSAALDAATFAKAYGGSREALAAMAPSAKPGYYALVLAEVREPNQVTVGGKTYNIYTTTGTLTLRLLRADGSLVKAVLKDEVRGQGGTPSDAVSACLVAMRDLLDQALKDEAEAFRKALAE